MTYLRHRPARNPTAQQSLVCYSFRSEAREVRALKRREFISLLGASAAAWPLAATAQQGNRGQVTVWMGRPNDAEGLRLAAALITFTVSLSRQKSI